MIDPAARSAPAGFVVAMACAPPLPRREGEQIARTPTLCKRFCIFALFDANAIFFLYSVE
jgi:hypothetical protein